MENRKLNRKRPQEIFGELFGCLYQRGAVTVREQDLITDRIPIDFVNQSASRSPGHIISDKWVCRIPLPHGHGSVRVASEDHRKGNP